MAVKNPKLFRASALNQMSSPDNLERLTPIVNSRDWLILAVIAGMFTLALVWCLFGSLPTVVSGRGILLDAADGASTDLGGVAYFPIRDGERIRPGMPIQIIPDGVERERFGGILGVVTSVSASPVTRDEVIKVVGDAGIADFMTANGTYLQVTAQLNRDPSTVSGYRWSSVQGPPFRMTPGLTSQTRVIVERRRPVSYLIPILKDAAGF